VEKDWTTPPVLKNDHSSSKLIHSCEHLSISVMAVRTRHLHLCYKQYLLHFLLFITFIIIFKASVTLFQLNLLLLMSAKG